MAARQRHAAGSRAEYGMLPGSTGERKQRDATRGRPDGRTVEIQRLIGRSLRAVVDFEALGERTVWVDCDVLQADGGTRCASICGGYVALARGVPAPGRRAASLPRTPLTGRSRPSRSASSTASRCSTCDYAEDPRAEVDMNVVMTGDGRLVEVQGTAERTPFDRAQLDRLLELGRGRHRRIAPRAAQAVAPRREPACGSCSPRRTPTRPPSSRGCSAADVEPLADASVGGDRRDVRGQRAAQGRAAARGAGGAASGWPTTPGSRWRARRRAGRALGALAGEDATDADPTRSCSRASRAPPIAPRRFVCRARRRAPDGPRSSPAASWRGDDRRGAARRAAASATTRSSCPTGEPRTVAELTPGEKDAISHRGRASRALAPRSARITGARHHIFTLRLAHA